MMGRRGKRRKQLLHDLKETGGYRKLKEEAQNRRVGRRGRRRKQLLHDLKETGDIGN